MHTENLLVHNGRERHPIKARIDRLPDGQSNAISGQRNTLSLERRVFVQLHVSIDVAKLVVAAQQHNLFRMQNFERKQINDDLERMRATVDVISQEHYVCRTQLHAKAPKVFGKEHEVFKVAVNVAENVSGRRGSHENGFTLQHSLDLFAERPNQLEPLQLVGHPLMRRLIPLVVVRLKHNEAVA